jgi:ABC-2 type transport system ATP-binding protein
MKQRLHLAKALLHDPPILFLDEPTIGLDPASAVDLRRAVAALVPDHTVLLTTHDMHEADQLCREIAIVDHGRIVAQGTPDELKSSVSEGRRVVISTHQPLNGHYGEVAARLSLIATVRAVQQDLTSDGGSELTILCNDTANALDEALAIVRGIGASVNGVRVVEPTLEDAFLAIAGGRLQSVQSPGQCSGSESGGSRSQPRRSRRSSATTPTSSTSSGSRCSRLGCS